jgi:hypothetical protein
MDSAGWRHSNDDRFLFRELGIAHVDPLYRAYCDRPPAIETWLLKVSRRNHFQKGTLIRTIRVQHGWKIGVK